MIYINITSFITISQLEKDHSMIETCHLKKIFFRKKIKSCAVKKGFKEIYYEQY